MASKQAKVAQRDASQKLTKKNLYFQRLLLLRYLVAFFFFFNLYWLLAASLAGQWLRVVPLSLLLFSMGPVSEFIRLYGHHATIDPKQLFFTTWYLRLQAGTMIILFLLTFFGVTEVIFPYFTSQSTEYVRIVLWISGVFAWSGVRKLKKIFRNKDKHWQWIREFEEIERKGD
ncbi:MULTISPECIES: hypothetical protein [unclassified Enterococcus]|uniref:hypothetical protein n=1 Tax=unclassified Enterococcus TaxID=2608891 RepID=UPI0019075623|nr:MULTISPECIES: hypothetical protein [unclassified Enterococcus]MBK0036989.1 hypothetical protein [Enterococcus sp. S52]MBK0069652.1 hypothetical protein [Enterococcus sp. S53]MBK0140245.1 hypothetical protein [Enterococcus sp. S76]MBK0144082.1 hypothetical protein [Enterococcus sp. S77]